MTANEAERASNRVKRGVGLPRAVCGDTRGAIMTEYAVVVGVCGILISAAIASLGVPLITGYGEARKILISTVP